jgi:hypothetical protein
MYALSYYAPHYKRTIHEAILRLLDEIRTKHAIPSELFEFRHRKSEYSDDLLSDQDHEREVYEQHFLTRAAVLKARVGGSLRHSLRSNSGGYFIAGIVAITRDGRVEWFTHHDESFSSADADPALGFLRAVLDGGPALLDQLCPPVIKGAPEQLILDAFLRAGVLRGRTTREFRIGSRRFTIDGAVFDWRKSIDLVVENDTEVWILEAKTRLTYTALGEVLTYASLYKRAFPSVDIRAGIVCGPIDEEILAACNEHRVTVFQVVGSDVKTYSPSFDTSRMRDTDDAV